MVKHIDQQRGCPMLFEKNDIEIADHYSPTASAVLYQGDCLDLLAELPRGSQKLIVTSPPYNIGKSYEKHRKLSIDEYLEGQRRTIAACVDALDDEGSICWEVGNHINGGQEIYPLDILLYPVFKSFGLQLRNRIVWHFEHGLHCSRRFSGRYETILWFTKTESFTFNLDAVRVPQKYPGKKYFKGPKAGQYSANPLGKNPGDLWIIPNVKHNHPEKTSHPCQFPVELVERLTLALTNPGDWVLDPYMGVGTSVAAAIRQGRKGVGAEIVPEYVATARERVYLASQGLLRTRPLDRPVYEPPANSSLARRPALWDEHVEQAN
jgi:adenine-specific DNA-methyltransferase